MHTKQSLEPLTKEKLLKLAEYLGVPGGLSMKMLKGDIIKEILDYTAKINVVKEEPQMSVRIKRIKESQEKLS
jgi:hypothetical protein